METHSRNATPDRIAPYAQKIEHFTQKFRSAFLQRIRREILPAPDEEQLDETPIARIVPFA